jgi:hypothetical protein
MFHAVYVDPGIHYLDRTQSYGIHDLGDMRQINRRKQMTVYKPEIRFKNVVSILNVQRGDWGTGSLQTAPPYDIVCSSIDLLAC